MAVTAFKTSGTQTNVDNASGATWSNMANVNASDDAWATASVGSAPNHTDFMQLTNFGFTDSDIPAGSLIDGVEVSVERSEGSLSTATVNDDTIKLIKGGVQTGDNKASATNWPTSDGTVVYGSSTDGWNAGLAQTDIVASNFGVAIAGKRSGGTGSEQCRVDHVQLRVYFTVLGARSSQPRSNQAVMRAATR